MSRSSRIVLTVGYLAVAASSSAQWPDYRGPDRLGVYAGPPLSAEIMAAAPEPRWQVEVGDGHASMTVAGGRVFAVGRRDGRQTLAAIDVESGDEVWTYSWKSDYGGFPRSVRGRRR